MNILVIFFSLAVFFGSFGLVEYYTPWHLPLSANWLWLGYLAFVPALVMSVASSFVGYKLARSTSDELKITMIEFVPPLWLGGLLTCAFILTWQDHPVWQWLAVPLAQTAVVALLAFTTEAIAKVTSLFQKSED